MGRAKDYLKQTRLWTVREVLRSLPQFLSNSPLECPICGFEGPFQAVGYPPRPSARCPQCASEERHRLLVLEIDRQGLIEDGARVLHFAPEPSIRSFLSARRADYTTADLFRDDVDLNLDIEHIEQPDETFDVIVCSHVLEHVDDRAALTELFRILRPEGLLIVMIPVVEGWDQTYENPDVVTPEGRAIHFGQDDHVRYYGRDVRTRITDAGFHLREVATQPADCLRYGLYRGERIFLATKPER